MPSISHLLCGLLIGAACILPGLSGGAFAASLGVYAPILKAVNRLPSRPKESLVFLLPFALGGLLGLFVVPLFLTKLFARWPLPAHMVFLGLLMGGIPSMERQLRKTLSGIRQALFSAALFLTVFGLTAALTLCSGFLSGHNSSEALRILTPSLAAAVLLFFTGFLSAATIVIPGVSGSMLLMMLGLYQPLLSSISSFVTALISGSLSLLFREILILFPLALGLLLGILSFAQLMERLLDRHPAAVLSAVLGLLSASPLPVLKELPPDSLTEASIPKAVLFFALSLSAAVLWMGKEQDMASS